MVKDNNVLDKCNKRKEVPKENMYYTCIACITIDSLMRMDKQNYPQVYLEECNYRVKNMQKLEISKTKKVYVPWKNIIT